MFKAPKRKRPTVIKRTDDSDDENQEVQNANNTSTQDKINATKEKMAKRKKKKKLKKGGAGGLSFSIDEGDDHDIDDRSSKKDKKRKRKGLGFGGSLPFENENDEEINEAKNLDKASTESSGYSKDDLAKLKSQQKIYIAEKTEEVDVETKNVKKDVNKEQNSSVPLPPRPDTVPIAKPVATEEDYISLDPSRKKTHDIAEDVIMTGDEAMKYSIDDDHYENDDNQKKAEIKAKLEEAEDENIADADDENWEDQIAKRAGLTNQNDDEINDIPSHRQSFQKEHGSEEVSKIKQTIASAIENISQQQLDLESAIVRKKHDAQEANKEATVKEKELADFGRNFEYYQSLRSNFADWIGALRYLSQRIDTIENALADLYQDVGAKRFNKIQEWEDDVANILREKDLVDYIVGRKPIDTSSSSKEVIVDEFGRDLKSSEVLARGKRHNERRRIWKESRDRRQTNSSDNESSKYEDSENDVSDNEVMDRGERRNALSDAVRVTLDELDDHYTSIKSLFEVFQTWDSRDNEDFKQCFAVLSMVELSSVFLRCAITKDFDPLCMTGKGKRNIKSLDDIDVFVFIEKETSKIQEILNTDSSKSPSHLMIEKYCVPYFRFFLKGTRSTSRDTPSWSFDPLSRRQNECLSMFCTSMIAKTTSLDVNNVISTDFLGYLNDYIQERAVIIVQKHSPIPSPDSQEYEAYEYASLGQIQLLKQLVQNILKWWYPMLGNPVELAKFVLGDIITFRMLPIVENFENKSEEISQYIVQEFKALVKWLKDENILDNEDLLMISSPIRAFGTKLGVI